VQLPDRRAIDIKVDFSMKTFNAVVGLCKELGIRHPEELSLAFPLGPEHLKHNFGGLRPRVNPNPGVDDPYRGRSPLPPPDTNSFIVNQHTNGNGTLVSYHDNA